MDSWAQDKLTLIDELLESSRLLAYSLNRSSPNPSGSIQDLPARHLSGLVEYFSEAVKQGAEKEILRYGEDIQEVADEFELPTLAWVDLFENLVSLFPVESSTLLLSEEDNLASCVQIVDSAKRILDSVRADVRNLYKLRPEEFERLVAEMFYSEGYATTVTPASRDGGIDIIAVKSHMGINTKHLIECKRYAEDNKVGIAIVQRLYGVTIANQANQGIVVTTSSFSKDAIGFSKLHPWHIQLKAKDWLLSWLKS